MYAMKEKCLLILLVIIIFHMRVSRKFGNRFSRVGVTRFAQRS